MLAGVSFTYTVPVVAKRVRGELSSQGSDSLAGLWRVRPTVTL